MKVSRQRVLQGTNPSDTLFVAERKKHHACTIHSVEVGDVSEAQPPTKRAKKGERDKQFLAFVKEHPDKNLSEIARGIGIQPQSANGVAKRLVEQGEVENSKSKTYRVA